MSPTAITALIILIVVIVGGVSFAVIRSKRLKDDLAQLTPEQRQRHEQIVAADKVVRAAQSDYDRAVRAAEKALREAQSPAVLAKVGRAAVSETTVVISGVVHPLVKGISAQVDETGGVQKFATSRTTATRVVAGALVAGPVGAIVGGTAKKTKVHTSDTREVYLVVTGPDWQEVLQLPGAQGGQARQFAATLYSASMNAESHLAQFESRLVSARASHEAAVANTGPLEAAKAARTVLELDPLDELRRIRKEAKDADPSLPPTE